MRLRNFFIGILLCALALSGWSSVLAATLCPYAARAVASAPTLKTDEHASCHAKSGANAADNSNSAHEAMGEMEATTRTGGESLAVSAQLVESCMPCCISHGNLPTAPVNPRESQQNGREKNHTAQQEVKTVAPPIAAFVPAVVPVQGSPPGQLTRRHLLLNIFII